MIEITATVIICIVLVVIFFIFGFFVVIIIIIVLIVGGIIWGGFNFARFISGGDKSVSETTKNIEREQQTYKNNICNTGPQNALNGLSCGDIESKNIDNLKSSAANIFFNNEQNIFMREKNINFQELGHKFKGEVCWSNEIQNCTSNKCLEKNRNNKDLAICKIKENAVDNKYYAFFDPGNVNLMKRYNMTENDFK